MKRLKSYRRAAQWITLAAIFVIPLLNVMEVTFIKGTFYSLDIGDVALADPLAVFQVALVSKTLSLVMLASVVFPVFLVLLLGRVWCSWFCPYYFFTEMVERLRNLPGLRTRRNSYQEGSASRQNAVRFSALGIGLLLAGITGIPALNLISAPGIISSQALVLVKFHTVTFELVLILVLLVLEFFLLKYWCRLLCPTGSFLSLLQWRRGLKVTKIRENCSECGTCIQHCPMQINPMTEGNNPMCHNCGICIDNCPDNEKNKTLCFRFY